MHRDMQFAVHTGEGGANVSAPPPPPRAPETLAARAASGLGYRWRGVADRRILRSRRPRAGRGLTRGFSRAGAWGPGRGGGGCAWLGWRCSPFNRRRRASPPPPAPSPAAPRARPGARPLPGPARAGAASRLGRQSARRALRAAAGAAGAAGGTGFGGGSGGGGARRPRMRRPLLEPGAAAAARE